jgi:hypothetical protein
MKPSTVKNRMSSLIADLTDVIIGIGECSEEEVLMLKETLEHLESSTEAFKKFLKIREKTRPSRSRKRSGTDRSVFINYDYTCAVCGLRDTSSNNLSSVRLCADPKKPGHRICMCKVHAKEFKNRLPWKDRDPKGESALNLVHEMEEQYKGPLAD